MHYFYNISDEWVSTVICVQVGELIKPTGYLQYTDRSRLVAVDLSLQGSLPLVDFSQPTPHRTRTPVNRRLRCAGLCTVFCTNDVVRTSPPEVSKQSGTGQTALREIPPLSFLFKKGGGIYF